MSAIPTKTYPPSFVQAIIDEAAADATTQPCEKIVKLKLTATEDGSGIQQGDTMSETERLLAAIVDIQHYIKHGTDDDTCAACPRWDELQGAAVAIVDEVTRLKAEVERLRQKQPRPRIPRGFSRGTR